MLVRRIARPMLASIFVTGGVDALRNPADKVAGAEPVVGKILEVTKPAVTAAADASVDAVDKAAAQVQSSPVTTADDAVGELRSDARAVASGQPLPFETETYVKVNGAVQVGAGVLLAFGKAPRLASTALAATIIPTTLAAHRFWEHEGDEREAQQIHFMKNVGLLGGLILAAVDTQGKPDLAWRAQHLGQDVAVAGKAAAANAVLGKKALKANAKAAKRLANANAKAAGKSGKLGIEVLEEALVSGAASAGEVARKASKKARKAAKKAGEQAQVYAEIAQDRGADAAGVAQFKGLEFIHAARSSDTAANALAKSSEFSHTMKSRGRELAEAARDSDFADVAAARANEATRKARKAAKKARKAANR